MKKKKMTREVNKDNKEKEIEERNEKYINNREGC